MLVLIVMKAISFEIATYNKIIFYATPDKVYAITPVPGGIGPMTITMLLHNTLEAFYHHQGE